MLTKLQDTRNLVQVDQIISPLLPPHQKSDVLSLAILKPPLMRSLSVAISGSGASESRAHLSLILDAYCNGGAGRGAFGVGSSFFTQSTPQVTKRH